MTKKTNHLKRTIFGATLLFAGALTLGSCSKKTEISTVGIYTLSGSASGSQVVPAVTTNGTAQITGTYNPNSGQINYTVSWVGLSDRPNGGGIFAGANPGETGVAFGNPFSYGDYNTYSTGSTTGSYLLNGPDEETLVSGQWYYTLTTGAFPGGEVRGQITATR